MTNENTTKNQASPMTAVSANGPTAFAAVVVIAVALFVACSAVMMPFQPDDAFVSFRYAENLADGHGLTFNPGERPIEGYSNFLWILVCAAVYKIGFDLPTAMPWVGVFFGALNLLALAGFYRRRRLSAAEVLIPLLLFALAAPFVTHSITGMETPLFSLLLLTAMIWVDAANTGGRMISYLGLAVTGTLLALCRPEGLIAFPVIVVARRFLPIGAIKEGSTTAGNSAGGRPLWAASGVFAVLVIAYHVWRISYFGAVIPPSFAARFGGGGPVWQAWTDNFRMYFVTQGSDHLPSGYFTLLLAVGAVIGASMSPARRDWKKTEQTALILAGVFSLIYFNFVDPMPGLRYHAPLIGLFFIPGVYLQNRVMKALAVDKSLVGRLKVASLIVVALALSFSWVAYLKMGMTRTETGNQDSAVALADWLREALPRDATLAINEAGIIPYYSDFRTVDIAPKPVVGDHPAGRWWDGWFFDTHSDVIVLTGRGIFYATMAPEHYELVSSPRFNSIYRLLGVVRYDWFEDQSFWVYIPKDRPPFDDALLDKFPLGIGSVKRLYRR
ncbi:MAG: hypothetical protein P8181_07165 [bacterium]